MKNLFLLFFIASGLCASSQVKSKAKPAGSEFRIQIQGKLLDNCPKPPDVTFGDFHGSDTDVQTMNVNDKGEFTANYILKEPGLFYFKKGQMTQYFMISPKEKMYKVELECSKNILAPLQIQNSPENKTYQEYLTLRQKLNADLENYREKNLDDAAVYHEFASRLRDYQKALALSAKRNPLTYTASYLAKIDQVNEKDLSSIQNLRLNYLKRTAFADKKFYNTTLPTFILENYIDFISDKNDASFAPFEWLLNTASKNTDAAKRLQNVLYEAIFKSKRQELMSGYISWAKAHPDKILHLAVQTKLQQLSKSMIGAQFVNMTLKDTLGNERDFKTVVDASKYTLLIFYSPGCGHCKETLPKLIPIWEKYQSKGFKVYSVAAKTDDGEWTDFLKKHTTAGWVNVIDEPTNRHFGEYSITSLPSFLLIDTQGKIVSRMDAHAVLTGISKWFE